MYTIRDPNVHSIAEIVSRNTGMSAQDLLNDRRNYVLKDRDRAARIIVDSINAGRTVYIFGDYDVDGIMATAILKLALEARGANVVTRLPRRFTEGYGISQKAVEEFQDGQLLITVDNGISAFEAVKRAKEKGMTVIITDHHLPVRDADTGAVILPDADLVIDPNAEEDPELFKDYCGAGIAYRIAVRLLGTKHPLAPKLTSLAAIATIADAVPLIGDNRRIVKYGLKYLTMPNGTTSGVFALLSSLFLTEYVSTESVSFRLAPTLNAPGRLMDDGSDLALELAVFEGPFMKARDMSDRLVEYNRERKELQKVWLKAAQDVITEHGMDNDLPIVAYVPGMPEGIIGTIAGMISDTYRTPCFILGDTSVAGVTKGSARSYGPANLKEALDHCGDLLLRYGGHAGAAGLSVTVENIDALRAALKEALRPYAVTRDDEEQEFYDLAIHPNEVTKTVKEVLKYGPYGQGCPAPVIMVEDLYLIPKGCRHYMELLDGTGIKLNAEVMDAVNFSGAREYHALGDPRHVTLVGTLSMNYCMGKYRPQMEYKAILPVGRAIAETQMAAALRRQAEKRYA